MPDKTTALFFAFFNEVGIIGQLSRALFEARLPDGFLTTHFSVLNHLVRLGDGKTPLDLARAFQVPKTTMTHTLSVLEKHGLVRVAPNPKDGRSKCVWITPAGAAFRQDAIGALAPVIARMAGDIAPGQIERLLPDLAAIRTYLDQNRP